MSKIRRRIVDIIHELKGLQRSPASLVDKDDDFTLPRMIAAGNGGSIIVSRKIDEIISLVADQLMTDDPTLARKYTRSDWQASVRRAFGPPLARIDLDDDPSENANLVVTDIRAELSKQVSGHGILEFAFGCTMFDNTAVKPFAIGVVRFESRLDWLSRKYSEGGIPLVTRRRVERALRGKSLRKRMQSYTSNIEADILDSLGNCAFVCSVTTNGLAGKAGQEKALTAARLATAAIALLWQTPSKTLEGLNLLFDRIPHRQKYLAFIPGKIVLAGSRWSHMPHGPWVSTGEWEKLFLRNRDHFAIVGNVLDYVVSPTDVVARPKMMNTLAQSLLWFYEGCRETVTLMAIVKFSASLDALACGGKARGIRHLINARLGMQDGMPIRPGGPSLKQVIDEIYSDGRSRTIHGTNDKLGHDWSVTRDVAEQFGRLCLLVCIDWAASNPSSDEPSKMLQ
jgi:hypothetical protein